MYILIQLLLLGTVKLLALRYQNPINPVFPFESCWPHDRVDFQAFFHIMVDDDQSLLPNIAGKVLNATFSQTLVQTDSNWRYYLTNEESYVSLVTNTYDERYVTVREPTAILTFNFTDITDDFALFADEDGIVSTLVISINLENSYVKHQNGEFSLSFRFSDITYSAKLLAIPAVPSYVQTVFDHPRTFDKGCFTIKFAVPCKFLPESTIVELMFDSPLNSLSSNNIDVMQTFDEKACNVKLNGTIAINQSCTKEANKLWVRNVLARKSYDSAYELQFCDLRTPTANIQNFAFKLYDRDLNQTSVYLNATIPLAVFQPSFHVISQDLASQVCGAAFEQRLKIKFPVPLRLDSSFSIRLQFSEGYLTERDLWIFSQALNLKEKYLLPKNGKGHFEYTYDAEPIWLTEIDLQIGGVKNPLTPGPANFIITFGFDDWQSIVSTLTINNSFFYDAIDGLALNVSSSSFIDLQNLELSFPELLQTNTNEKFQIEFSFENCYSWTNSSHLQIEGIDYDLTKLTIENKRYMLNIKQLEFLERKNSSVSFKQLRISKDFSSPSKLKILIYHQGFLAYSVERQITGSQKAIKDGQVLVEQASNLFTLSLLLIPNYLTSGHFLAAVSSVSQHYANMNCQFLESSRSLMKNCTRDESISKAFSADFSELDWNVEPKIVISLDKDSLNQTSTDTLAFEFYIAGNNTNLEGHSLFPFEQSIISIQYALLESCRSLSISSNACTVCANDYELDSTTKSCKKRTAISHNTQRQLFSINMVLDDFLRKIYSGLCFNLFAMVFILSCVFKVLFAHNFDWIQFHGIVCKLIWLIVSYAYLLIIAITFDTDKLRHLLFIVIHLSINTLASIIFFVKLLALFGSRLWIGQSTLPKIVFSFIVVLSGTSPILFTKSFKDRFMYLEYLVGPDLHNSYKVIWAIMMWYSVIFHLASLTFILALLVPIGFDQMVAFLLLTCFNIALNSCLLIISSRKATQNSGKQFTGILGTSDKYVKEEVSEIEALIRLECESNSQNGNFGYTASDYLPLKNVLEKLQSFRHIESEES